MNETELNRSEQSYRRRQRFLMPALIVLVALPMLYWSKRLQSQRLDQLHEHMQEVATMVVKGDDPTHRLKADSPTKRDGFVETLQALLGELDDPQRVQIEAFEGDTSPFADGRATHTVHLLIDGDPALGIRLAWPRDGAMTIVGFWFTSLPDDELEIEG